VWDGDVRNEERESPWINQPSILGSLALGTNHQHRFLHGNHTFPTHQNDPATRSNSTAERFPTFLIPHPLLCQKLEYYNPSTPWLSKIRAKHLHTPTSLFVQTKTAKTKNGKGKFGVPQTVTAQIIKRRNEGDINKPRDENHLFACACAFGPLF